MKIFILYFIYKINKYGTKQAYNNKRFPIQSSQVEQLAFEFYYELVNLFTYIFLSP